MAHGPRYHVKPRRRRWGVTDYRKRLRLLKSKKPRLVIRKTLRNTLVQFVEYKEKGDHILTCASSKDLVSKYKWKHSTSNTPAAYLTGLIAGKKAKDLGVKECVLDIGRYIPTTGGKLFASLKGVVDAGVICPHDETKLPSDERLYGKHIDDKIMKDVDEIKKTIIGGK